ncbi:hypothetical protein HGRIS_010852 [Hohenbuehelia grisea]|uniref:Uncharacterized protein n=1 Tax=Hohenbuehelia grisea TaxID=104357 RepID=A0ABR3IY17_9AGAR
MGLAPVNALQIAPRVQRWQGLIAMEVIDVVASAAIPVKRVLTAAPAIHQSVRSLVRHPAATVVAVIQRRGDLAPFNVLCAFSLIYLSHFTPAGFVMSRKIPLIIKISARSSQMLKDFIKVILRTQQRLAFITPSL